MRIYEYEAKELFREVGIAVPMSGLPQPLNMSEKQPRNSVVQLYLNPRPCLRPGARPG